MIQRACFIDDDEIYLFWATKMVAELKTGDDILVYQDGQEAITGLKTITEKGEKLPDIIFLDINMPIMNGWDFLEEFMQLPNHNKENVLVYIVSSSIAQEDLEKAKEFDIVHNYILKPITLDDFKTILKSPIKSS